ncbi:GNAT family N-acetyltransferase [Actinoplanes hulinensis]|uniref:GNAT family N-acetyltransferase n=1 Tax=Actinoplanes hulinensis TaxID=1144547 RepID=A0ABS7AZI1_9ACTN|nr:GNAT family N-acetyltransferase [Actinoplanes hulinensis]MBW6433806.1 GNAT family N-acetyltransferase [Actinoplanes hulinensis]
MTIRQATPDDAAALAVVHVRTWQATYAGQVPGDYLDSLDPAEREPVWRSRLAGISPPAAVLVWDDGGVPVGFAALRESRDGEVGAGEITAIYLLPEHWGRGAGRALMAAALRHLAGAGFGEATLWVLGSNVRARRFYEAAGWRPDGAEKVDDSYGFPLAEVRYRRGLDDQGLRPTAP